MQPSVMLESDSETSVVVLLQHVLSIIELRTGTGLVLSTENKIENVQKHNYYSLSVTDCRPDATRLLKEWSIR